MKSSLNKEQKKDLISIIAALFIFAAIMFLQLIEVLPGDGEHNRSIGVIYLIPYIIVGYPVLKGCFFGIIHGKFFDEKFLMTLATFGAIVTGEYGEAVAVILFYQIGELFQDYAIDKSRRSIKALMEIAPEYAIRESEDGGMEKINPDIVEIGDILIIKPGEKIPVDGEVIFGESEMNTAAITGESLPIFVRVGDNVISGSINGDSLIKIIAKKTYDDSTVARILELVEESFDKKSKSEKFITKFAKYYTPVIVIAAVALFLIPGFITAEWSLWMLRACTFLVISCPCALVISVPLAFFGGVGAASREGILVKGSNYIETLSKVDTILTDKTGTITTGEFEVIDVKAFEGMSESDVLGIASAIETSSSHPIAKSICKAYEELKKIKQVEYEVSELKNISGYGISAIISGEEALVGNRNLMNDNDINLNDIQLLSGTLVYVAINSKLIGIIAVADEEKKEASRAISRLRENGIKRILMLTGDRGDIARNISDRIGLDGCYAGLLPEDKVRIIEEYINGKPKGKAESSTKSGMTAYIGDGINDAPVLSRADVGIAMGGAGSDAAIEAADIVIMDDNLEKIDKAIKISKKTVMIAWQNIIFALVIKILFLILGAFGIIGMWWAVFADVGVAVLCILNSMRMLKNRMHLKA